MIALFYVMWVACGILAYGIAIADAEELDVETYAIATLFGLGGGVGLALAYAMSKKDGFNLVNGVKFKK